ncbi:MAG: TetR family transcriptional regulator [Pseudonocardiales bacterium]|nr:TetR family transcriptional regulator [Pseudonocardiales bacterium]
MDIEEDAEQRAVRLRNARGQGARLRFELLEAAMRVLDESAAADLTLRVVAREAGVSPQAVYAHFSGRQELTYEVIRMCWQQVADEMARASRRARNGGALLRLRAQLRAYLKYATDSPAKYQLLFALRPEGVADSGHQTRPAEPAYLSVLRDVEALRDEGYSFPGFGVHDSTLMLLSLVHGRVALAHTAPDRPWNTARSMTTYLNRILDGLFRLG